MDLSIVVSGREEIYGMQVVEPRFVTDNAAPPNKCIMQDVIRRGTAFLSDHTVVARNVRTCESFATRLSGDGQC
jgi:hypothetical protein